eukprot:CAMPEP_0113883738 /NCGR_PEP_ID=MMETSP0780_2-20120614/9790_1 /TAXON_ID=652834 /ORGANISM="Palpitomonas bilix" /LENGTH=622 /DNA_ID=CAMNT_0000871123 /DNA_START=378 /DNA_END=2246 /DNA_ORIENTATION=- /assembly_acc=CAM_ASM_000599
MAFENLSRTVEKDFRILLLLILYILQGIPMGLAASVPLLLQSKGASYKEQAAFAIVSSPYSLKLIWAPIVDSVYVKRIGRRKSWVMPIQLVVAFIFFFAAPRMGTLLDDVAMGDYASSPSSVSASSSSAVVTHTDEILKEMEDGRGGGGKMGSSLSPSISASDIGVLTGLFFLLYFLVATQDIAVDGWAISLLPKEIVGYASITNTIGQTLGYFLSYTIFLALHSPEFCNEYLRGKAAQSPLPILSTSSYFRLCGFLFLFVTLFVMIAISEDGSLNLVRRERAPPSPSHVWEEGAQSGGEEGEDIENKGAGSGRDESTMDLSSSDGARRRARSAGGRSGSGSGDQQWRQTFRGVMNAYTQALALLTSPRVRQLCFVLVTARMAFGAVDAATTLRLIDAGVPKEHLAVLAVASIPIEVVLPAFLARITSKPKPLRVWRKVYLLRIVVGVFVGMVVTHLAAVATKGGGGLGARDYALAFFVLVVYRAVSVSMFVIQMAFFAKVSDPRIGGTFMTLLNTFANLGGWWPNPLSLFMVDLFTSKQCVPSPSAAISITPEELLSASCSGGASSCTQLGGVCEAVSDGYLITLCVGAVVGVVYWFATRRILAEIENATEREWIPPTMHT